MTKEDKEKERALKCERCGVYVADAAISCPLCGMVLSGGAPGNENMYPDVGGGTKLFRRVINMISCLAAVLEIVLIAINYYNYDGVKWSAITGGAICYLILTLRYRRSRNGHIKKIFVQMLGAVALIVLIDFVMGWSGFSISVGIPAIALLMDFVIIACMAADRGYWHNYLLMQLFVLILSAARLLLCFFGVGAKALSWTAFAASAALFASCFAIGGGKAKNELSRKFHV